MKTVSRVIATVVLAGFGVGICSAAAVGPVYSALTEVRNEVPAASGANTWTLQNAPSTSQGCFRNGIFQSPGLDYTISGNVITSQNWVLGDTLACDYEMPANGSTLTSSTAPYVFANQQMYNSAIPFPSVQWGFEQDANANTSFNGLTVNIFNNGFIRMITNAGGTRFTNNFATTVASVDTSGNLTAAAASFTLNPFPIGLQHLLNATDFSAGAAAFYSLQSPGSSAMEGQVQMAMPGPGSASQMSFSVTNPPGVNNSIRASLRINSTSSGLTCAIGGASQKICNASAAVRWDQNDLLDWQLVPSGSIAQFTGGFSAQ